MGPLEAAVYVGISRSWQLQIVLDDGQTEHVGLDIIAADPAVSEPAHAAKTRPSYSSMSASVRAAPAASTSPSDVCEGWGGSLIITTSTSDPIGANRCLCSTWSKPRATGPPKTRRRLGPDRIRLYPNRYQGCASAPLLVYRALRDRSHPDLTTPAGAGSPSGGAVPPQAKGST
jgi:hypothetical protein